MIKRDHRQQNTHMKGKSTNFFNTLSLWVLAAFLVAGAAFQPRCHADSVTSQSDLYSGVFLGDTPIAYNWRGTVRVDYLLVGNEINIQRVDQSVDVFNAASYGNPLGMVANISVDVLANGSQKIATIYPSSNGSYLSSNADVVYGGVSYPNLRVVNPTFRVTMVVLAQGGFGWYSRSWKFSPNLAAAPSPVSLYRYRNNYGRGDRFYTTNFNELGSGGTGGWVYEGVQCHVYGSQVQGTVPLYRYINRGLGLHFYTTNFNELGNGGKGYQLEGVQCYVWDIHVCPADPNLRALYRYSNSQTGTHFYTTNFNELSYGAGNWNSEGIQCAVMP